MIAKKVHCLPENNDYSRLANYITDAKRDGEKTLFSWIDGCMDNTDYQLALQEIEAVQELNTRTKQNKTYHLIVSFRPEDSNKLTHNTLQDIEKAITQHLRLGDHQRVVAVHKNTANIHMHVAYNLVHPTSLTMSQPFRDYFTLNQACRILEKEYGLSVDNGIGQSEQDIKLTNKAADREIQTGEVSFERYALQFKGEILTKLASVHTWEEVHLLFQDYGMQIKPRGNGLSISDLQGTFGIKASTLDRSLSLKKMESVFGAYNDKKIHSSRKTQYEYSRQPLQRGAKRADLFNEYKALIAQRIERLQVIKEADQKAHEAIREKWQEEKKKLTSRNLSVRAQRKLLKLIAVKMQLELAPFKEQAASDRAAVKEKTPFNSWNTFLQQKAHAGDEMALAILRSRNVEIEPQKDIAEHKKPSLHHLEKQRKILTSNLQYKKEKVLLNIVKMSEAVDDTFTYNIDKKGVVLFSFPNGTMIQDYGNKVVTNAAGHDMVERYVKSRWGKHHICESGIYRYNKHSRQREADLVRKTTISR